MNREIKFRAKAKDYDPMVMPESGWVEGFYYEDLWNGEIKSFIKNSEMDWEIEKHTIVQFTGKIDKNKKEIFSGDLLKDQDGVIYKIWYSEDTAAFMAEMVNPSNDMVDILGGYDTERCFEVIGNIFDNKNLLEE